MRHFCDRTERHKVVSPSSRGFDNPLFNASANSNGIAGGNWRWRSTQDMLSAETVDNLNHLPEESNWVRGKTGRTLETVMTRIKAVAKSHDRGESALHVGHGSYDRHLVFDHVVSLANASQRERFEAVARFLRDLLTERWLLTQETYDKENPKRVYYLSMD